MEKYAGFLAFSAFLAAILTHLAYRKPWQMI
jgi:hypothetical protein